MHTYNPMNICNPLLHLSPSNDDYCRAIVTIPFGSGHEPEEWPGLAHLLEHALFLGSHALFLGSHALFLDSYALAEGLLKARSGSVSELAAGELQGLMAQKGIRINASTRLEQSCYMIECLPDQLEEAFTRLCQLIYAPIFSAEQVISEISIIDGEYQAYCEHPAQQLLNLIQTQAHPKHRFYHFLAGNRASLGHNDPELLKQLNLCFQQGYLRQSASLYIEHPEGLGFEAQGEVLYARLEAIRHYAIRNHSKQSEQALTTNPQVLSDPDKPASAPFFCGQQTFLAVTDQPVIQWVWPVSNPSINELLLTFRTLNQLAKALQIPGEYSLSLAMQWQQQAALLVETGIPESVDTLEKIQVHAQEQLAHFQKQLSHGCNALITDTNKNIEEFAEDAASQPKGPALLRATETAIQYQYAALFTGFIWETQTGRKEMQTEVIKDLLNALDQPPAVTLISHPGFEQLKLDQVGLDYQFTAFFPTRYLAANLLAPAGSEGSAADILTQQLAYPKTPSLMPFRAVMQKLAETKLTQDQHQICLHHTTQRNHAAVIWRDIESLNLRNSSESKSPEELCSELYPGFYRKLRIEQRIGYIVQIMPYAVERADQTAQLRERKQGIAFLIQSASYASDQLIEALNRELKSIQQMDKPQSLSELDLQKIPL